MNPRFAFLTLILCAHTALAEAWEGTAEVKFKGYSTLHNFTGTVSGVPLKVTVTGERGSRVVGATSNVEVKQMNTKDDARDKNMWAMFNEAKYRLIKVSVTGAREQDLKPAGGRPGTMPISLTIAGTTGKVAASVTQVVESAEAVSFDLAFPVSLPAFKLDPPKAVGGLVKVKETVEVTARITLKRSTP